MSVSNTKPTRSAKALPGDNAPLRARDAEQVIAPGVDAGIDKPEPATSWTALRGAMKVGQHERFHTLGWYLAIILAIVTVGIVLGVLMM